MSRCVISMTIHDVEHYSEEERAQIIASYPAHEREARAKGIPAMGSGRVFPVPEEDIRIDPIQIPSYWPQIVGIDFGWDHPFAAARVAWDRDADCVYVTHTYRQREATPVIHAASVRPWGLWIPVAWPHDGYQHDKQSGNQLAQAYRDEQLNMLPEHATHEAGGYGLEAGVTEMLTRMQTGRFKVFSNLAEWFEEFRMYHRKNGLIVKERDDLMSSTRIALMMLRFASTQYPVEPAGDRYSRRKRGNSRSAWAA